MKPRTPEGIRYLRSDGTPSKLSRKHKEEKWVKFASPLEEVHSPQANLRSVVLELLHTRTISNAIIADGDKYVGVARLGKIAASIALWHDRNAPIYEILLEPIKRVEERLEPIDSEMSDKEVRELITKEPLLDLYPVVENGKLVASVATREALISHASEVQRVQLSEIALDMPQANTVGEALMLMNEKGVPAVLVHDKVLKARDVLSKIWEERRRKISELSFEDVLEEPQVVSSNLTLKDALDLVKPEMDDVILVSSQDGIRYVPWSLAFAHLL